MERVPSRSSSFGLIPLEPEELLRGGNGIGVRTRCVGNIGERFGAGRRGLQSESAVGPSQHQFVVQQLIIRARQINATPNLCYTRLSLRLPEICYLPKRELARVETSGPESRIKGFGIAAGVLPSDVSVREKCIETGYPFVPVRRKG